MYCNGGGSGLRLKTKNHNGLVLFAKIVIIKHCVLLNVIVATHFVNMETS